MLSLVRKAIELYRLCVKGDTLLVGYSGGPDSTALLCALSELRAELGIELVAAHLDHGQRPDSAQEREYCQRQARRLGLPVVTEQLPRGRRSEAKLRELRYEFFAMQTAMVGASAVATGHTATDRAETFLLNALRGSGSQGLASIPARSEHHGVTIVRPLILASREQILAWLDEQGRRYVVDASNAHPDQDRNRIRLEVFPILEAIRSQATRNIARACDVLSDEADYFRRRAAQFLDRRLPRSQKGQPPRGFVDGVLRAHPALARQVVRELIRRTRGDLDGISLAMIDDSIRLLASSHQDGRPRHLPLAGPWVMEIRKRGLRVVPGHRGSPS